MNTAIWERKDLKKKGKAAFKLNYWKCVLVALILGLVAGGGGGSTGSANSSSVSETINESVYNGGSTSGIVGDAANEISDALSQVPTGAWVAIVVIIAIAIIIGLAIDLFLLNPLQLGCYRFFSVNHYSPANLNEMGYGFTNNYIGNVKTMFVKDLYLFLWSLLFVIPGIVKSYSYRMVPYILSENPGISTKEAIDLSREMMDGNKWKAFVLDLSFIGWILLSVLTLGILAIFYVNPYMEATNAELYHALKPATDVDYGYTDSVEASYAEV